MAREKRQRIATEAAPEMRVSPFASLAPDAFPDSPPGGTGVPPVHEPAPATKDRLLLRRSTAHRGGKTVLVLEGFGPSWTEAKLRDLLHELKAKLGCGGKLAGSTMEIQGEQADRLQPLLEARGFAVKRGW